MTKIYKLSECAENSLITKDLGSIDYCDSYMIIKKTNDSIDEITKKLITLPHWAITLLKIRYFLLVKLFGLATGTIIHTTKDSIFKPVPIIHRDKTEIVMGENDKHLYYRISVMKKETGQGSEICLTTIVKFNNIWGKIYFFPIKPFHKFLVKSLLRNL